MSAEHSQNVEYLRSKLRQFNDFPSPGIIFEDILPIFQDPKAFKTLISTLAAHLRSAHPNLTTLIGLDARGFLFGPSLALELGVGFVPVRKQGKLPGPTISATYEKEYGQDVFEIQEGSVKEGDVVVVVDDIIATGGSAAAAGELVKKSGAKTVEYIFILELDFLKGREKLDAPAWTLLSGQKEGERDI
ncbi:adenine phosphoribosyltransferase [Saitoella complicata NRRL Y-17804]|uniref:adenine phosphoribosyltransferase n=1 Tax=Saitoella complicata (strain BCRC 22490 / CBS 7301 / JCM 7358 / NBRC 10748 / NRRL Y-17804) TaxID=698492 RepID=UPI000866AA98|nr:adenine phosphoribosyltransferase [Saitoella complicata NRRL Y-17804]ODQ54660.1 adenine phosphoribosyltransferase [Saitoella complicata NRRL Y-17804]